MINSQHTWSLVHKAVFNRQFEVVETLLRYANIALDSVDRDGCTPLHYADGIPMLELLVRYGDDTFHNALDCKDLEGKTPMHHVWDPLVLELLVRCGSDTFDVKDNFGDTPASSVWRGYWESPGLLISFLVLEGSEDRIAEYHEYCKQKDKQPITWTDDDALEIRFRTYFAHSLVYRLLYLSSLSDSPGKH
jgi:hypothetical protein